MMSKPRFGISHNIVTLLFDLGSFISKSTILVCVKWRDKRQHLNEYT